MGEVTPVSITPTAGTVGYDDGAFEGVLDYAFYTNTDDRFRRLDLIAQANPKELAQPLRAFLAEIAPRIGFADKELPATADEWIRAVRQRADRHLADASDKNAQTGTCVPDAAFKQLIMADLFSRTATFLETHLDAVAKAARAMNAASH